MTETRGTILVVEDEPEIRRFLRTSLATEGYRVVEAGTGARGAIDAGSHKPDLAIVDCGLPDIDGVQVIRRIRAWSPMPILVLSARAQERSKIEALDAGADDYITKPINFAELEARVNSLLRIKKLQSDLAESKQELSELNDKLRRISLTDGLTDIDNRRSLEERLGEMWQHSIRLHEPIALIMCDIDKFKSVNDNYGHQAGDSVLKTVAQLLKGAAREIDRVGRYGGEEFLLILSGTVLDAAMTFAQRLREIVEGHTFSLPDGKTITRTISCGVAAAPHPRVKDQEALLRAADDALYVAKETGRNRVVRFDGADFNEHTQGKGNNSSDGEKPVKQAAGSGAGSATAGATTGSKASAEGRRAPA